MLPEVPELEKGPAAKEIRDEVTALIDGLREEL